MKWQPIEKKAKRYVYAVSNTNNKILVKTTTTETDDDKIKVAFTQEVYNRLGANLDFRIEISNIPKTFNKQKEKKTVSRKKGISVDRIMGFSIGDKVISKYDFIKPIEQRKELVKEIDNIEFMDLHGKLELIYFKNESGANRAVDFRYFDDNYNAKPSKFD